MIIDCKSQLHEAPHQALLSLCLFEPTEEKLARFTKVYTENPAITVLGRKIEGAWAGLIIAKEYEAGEVELRCLAVDPSCQRQGVGRDLIHALISRLHPRLIAAETDGSTLGFYLRLGFGVTPLGEIYGGGEERFQCVLKLSDEQ